MTSEQWIAIEEVYAAILADAGVGLAAAFLAEHLHPLTAAVLLTDHARTQLAAYAWCGGIASPPSQARTCDQGSAGKRPSPSGKALGPGRRFRSEAELALYAGVPPLPRLCVVTAAHRGRLVKGGCPPLPRGRRPAVARALGAIARGESGSWPTAGRACYNFRNTFPLLSGGAAAGAWPWLGPSPSPAVGAPSPRC
jgi:hypothetical protein